MLSTVWYWILDKVPQEAIAFAVHNDTREVLEILFKFEKDLEEISIIHSVLKAPRFCGINLAMKRGNLAIAQLLLEHDCWLTSESCSSLTLTALL